MHAGPAPRFQHPFERGYPHPEKLIHIIGEYTQEFDPFFQRDRRVGSLLQHPCIKSQPTDIADNSLPFSYGHILLLSRKYNLRNSEANVKFWEDKL